MVMRTRAALLREPAASASASIGRPLSPAARLLTPPEEIREWGRASERRPLRPFPEHQPGPLCLRSDRAAELADLLIRVAPGSRAREVRRAVQAVEGVTAVRVNVTDGSAAPGATAHRPTAQRSTPGSVPPPPTPVELPHLGRVLAISSGKGGVGKSTVSVNLAVALARAGHRVGLMDADIYGPNIPRMMGVDQKPEVRGGKIQPLEAHGVKLMSVALIVERDAPAIWRGPIIMKVIGQFVKDVDWGELGVPLLGQVPLQARLPDLADTGQPVVAADPGSPAAQALEAVARRVSDAVAALPR